VRVERSLARDRQPGSFLQIGMKEAERGDAAADAAAAADVTQELQTPGLAQERGLDARFYLQREVLGRGLAVDAKPAGRHVDRGALHREGAVAIVGEGGLRP